MFRCDLDNLEMSKLSNTGEGYTDQEMKEICEDCIKRYKICDFVYLDLKNMFTRLKEKLIKFYY